MSYSRLSEDLFTSNLHYASSYWEEHRENVFQMITVLMMDENLSKMIQNASTLTLNFNHKVGWISQQYNMTVLYDSYDNLINQVSKRKEFLFHFMDSYFELLISEKDKLNPKVESLKRNESDIKSSPELVNLKSFFTQVQYQDKEILVYSKILLDGKTEEKDLRENYFPQLLLFFLRILDIYDKSLKGLSVQDFLKNLQNPNQQKDSTETGQIQEAILKNFGEKEFWDTRYRNISVSDSFDWFLSWVELKPLLNINLINQCLKKNDLNGCGNSTLSEDITSDLSNLTQIWGFDFCPQVIEIMKARSRTFESKRMDKIKYISSDVRKGMLLNSNSIDLVIDKGCLDCMVCTSESMSVSFQAIVNTLKEVGRILKSGGLYILISCGITADNFEKFSMNWKKIHFSVTPKQIGNTPIQLLVYQMNYCTFIIVLLYCYCCSAFVQDLPQSTTIYRGGAVFRLKSYNSMAAIAFDSDTNAYFAEMRRNVDSDPYIVWLYVQLPNTNTSYEIDVGHGKPPVCKRGPQVIVNPLTLISLRGLQEKKGHISQIYNVTGGPSSLKSLTQLAVDVFTASPIAAHLFDEWASLIFVLDQNYLAQFWNEAVLKEIGC